MEDSGLLDVRCKGKKYTWCSGDRRAMSRIDWFLVSDVIVNRWGVVGQLVGERFWLNLRIKENMLGQKSRLKWLNDGDSNSSFFTRMGFGMRWRRWMEKFVFQSSMSVLVNGSPTKEFVVEKGLRQGDPLSPFLFVLVTEGLAGLVRTSSENGTWRQVCAIKVVLKSFELVSGLGINYRNSKLVGINVNNNFLDSASFVLSCIVEGSKFLFLGIIIGCNPRRYSSWIHLLSKMKKYLVGWKNRFFSFGGRITLLKSIFSSLTIFTMSVYKMPIMVAKEFTRVQSNFLWGGEVEDNKRRIHWVSWKNVCLPLEKGGLGIKNISDFNLALHNKWRWRILKGNNSVWYNLLKARYGDLSMKSLCGGMLPLDSVSSSSSTSSYWWNDLISVGKSVGVDPMNFINGCGVVLDVKDDINLNITLDGDFLVASCYGYYAGMHIPFGPSNRNDVALALIWKLEVPFKLKAFGWRLFVNRLPAKDLLVYRRIALSMDNTKCVFCGIDLESRDHSFFKCKMVEVAWREVAIWIGKSDGDLEEDCLSCFLDWLYFCKKRR
ncbi:uncharacterized protein LOC131613586 [Vicia villosa]|uniref:uncharacterized protein LOC131613586 n=1 Tax=Vicia villosa TaxID=3911 RepID=UPI00273C8272|nr:uncharacterized protein LOC131613586 [Vicia villosa]